MAPTKNIRAKLINEDDYLANPQGPPHPLGHELMRRKNGYGIT